jgi:hypothetical protein
MDGWRMRRRLVLKTLGVTGRGYGRVCREAAIQNSPGLQPWVVFYNPPQWAYPTGGAGRNTPTLHHSIQKE